METASAPLLSELDGENTDRRCQWGSEQSIGMLKGVAGLVMAIALSHLLFCIPDGPAPCLGLVLPGYDPDSLHTHGAFFTMTGGTHQINNVAFAAMRGSEPSYAATGRANLRVEPAGSKSRDPDETGNKSLDVPIDVSVRAKSRAMALPAMHHEPTRGFRSAVAIEDFSAEGSAGHHGLANKSADDGSSSSSSSTSSTTTTTTLSIDWSVVGSGTEEGAASLEHDSHGAPKPWQAGTQHARDQAKHESSVYPPGLDTGHWEADWPCVAFATGFNTKPPAECAVYSTSKSSALPTLSSISPIPCMPNDHWPAFSTLCGHLGPAYLVTGFSSSALVNKRCCNKDFYFHKHRKGGGEWSCEECMSDVGNCPTLTWLYCAGIDQRLTAKQFLITAEDVLIFALYAMLLGAISSQQVSHHPELGCYRLMVEVLEWGRYLLVLIATTGVLVWSMQGLVQGYAAVKYDCSASRQVMGVFTPVFTAVSLAILLLGCGYLGTYWCTNAVEAASLQIDSAMSYRRAQRVAFSLTTTTVLSVLVYAVSAAWSNAAPCDAACLQQLGVEPLIWDTVALAAGVLVALILLSLLMKLRTIVVTMHVVQEQLHDLSVHVHAQEDRLSALLNLRMQAQTDHLQEVLGHSGSAGTTTMHAVHGEVYSLIEEFVANSKSVYHLFDLHAYQNRQWHDMMTQMEDLLRAHTELKELGSLMEEFIVNSKSVYHLFDLHAYQDRQWHDMMGQLEDLMRAHTELSKAVNTLLTDVSARMPKSTTAAAITAQISGVDDRLQALSDRLSEQWSTQLPKQINELIDQVEAGMRRLQEMRDKTREVLARVELFDKNLEKTHSMLQAIAKVIETIDPPKALLEISKPMMEKQEQLLRSKLQSVGEDVNLLKGQAHAHQGENNRLIKNLEKSLAQMQSVVDGLAVNMAQVGAAFGKPPVDSQGQTRALDLLLKLGESLAESVGVNQESRELSHEALSRSQEMNGVLVELRDLLATQRPQYATSSHGASMHSQPSRSSPTVIDLQSRLPPRASTGFATISYPDGSIKMISTDNLP
ncbi:unnamed protein product [Symbiodinium sp. CCMP2592]|nr:unnamed protein product [Symbiodinium sp. CCMP2592]